MARTPRPFGPGLRRLRLRRGLTQQQLASRAGITREQVSRLERGVHAPRYTTLFALSGALGVPVSRFLVPRDTDRP